MDIATLQRLAGINEFQGYSPYKIDENPSETATELKAKERRLGLKPGDILWTVPNTFVASANCGMLVGSKVDFVDINKNSFNIDTNLLKKK